MKATDRSKLLLHETTRTKLKHTVLSEKVRLKSYRLYDSTYTMLCKGMNTGTENRSAAARD